MRFLPPSFLPTKLKLLTRLRGYNPNPSPNSNSYPNPGPGPNPNTAEFPNTLQNLGMDADKKGKLQKCQGDCDDDSHCADGLKCFHRSASEKVHGRLGGIGDNLTLTLALSLTLTLARSLILALPLQVPGCWAGGAGDAPGFNDFCYDPAGGACRWW